MASNDFFRKVLLVTQLIPPGRVTTYGLIAKSLGMASSARTVGWALNQAAGDVTVPAHRVVNRLGELSGKAHFATPTLMRELLEAEGVTFINEAVNLKEHLWYPSELED